MAAVNRGLIRRRLRGGATFVAAMAPMLAVWIEKVIRLPRPVAAGYADPEVYFFYDALRLAFGEAPRNVDHPGTPVQLLGALAAWFTGRTPLAVDAYRTAMYSQALLLTAAGVIILMRTLLREVHPLAQVAVIWSFWICPAAMRHVAIWSPEAMFFFVAALALAAFHAYFTGPSARRAAWLGAAIGLCIAVKFVFLSWAIAAAAVIIGSKRVRHAALMLASTAAGFVIATLPAITRYDAMFRWVAALVTRRDWYGRAQPAGGNVLGDPAGDLVTAVMHAKAWHAWIVVAFLLLLLVPKRGDAAMRAAFVFAAIAIAVNYAMAAKGIVPKAVDFYGDIRYRYVLPSAAAALLVVAEACRSPRMQRTGAALLLFLASGVLVAKSALSEVRTHRALVAESLANRTAIEEAVGRVAGPEDVIVYDGADLPSYALRAHTYGEERFLRMVEEQWPHDGHMYDGRTYLPDGASHWDLFVIRPEFLARSPARGGVVVEKAAGHLLVKPAG